MPGLARAFRRVSLVGAGVFVVLAWNPAGASDPALIMGPNACAECHKVEAEIWKATHHATTYSDMPRSKQAREIADRLGIRRIKTEALCLTCHFTSQTQKDGTVRPIAGISCESCHAEGRAWIKVHSGYSGKKKETETVEEAKARWARSEAGGMIRPANLYRLAKNCYSCHVVPQEKLVNVGGHPAGSAFELVAWSQGEMRHNVWYTNGKRNREASAARKRLMFVVGLAVETETALRAVGKATEAKKYAQLMARRAAVARQKIDALARLLPDVAELKDIGAAARSAGLKLNNDAALSAAADKIGAATRALVAKYDGSTFGAIDRAIPGPDRYKGSPAR